MTRQMKGIKFVEDIHLFLAIWLIYCLHVVPGGGVNPNRYFDLTHSLVDQGTISIDAYHQNTIDKAFYNGHYYSVGLPGPSLAGVPAYLTFKAVYNAIPTSWLELFSRTQSYKQGSSGFYQTDTTAFFLSTIWITWFTLSVLSAAACVGLFHALQNLGVARRYALLSTILYAFGTIVFFYSTTYFSHTFTASITVFCLLLISQEKTSRSSRDLIGLGLLAGLTLLMEYQVVIIVGCFALFVLLKWGKRPLFFFLCGTALPLLMLMLYNTLAFGGPLQISYQYLTSSDRQVVHGQGLLGFTLPEPDRLWGLTFSPERGLFLYSPFLLLAPVGWFMAIRKRDPRTFGIALLSLGAALSLLLFMVCYAAWSGFAAFGPRQMVAALPFFILGAAFALDSIPAWIIILLAVPSILTNWLGAQRGFADTVYQHWLTFMHQGFTLPAISAVIDHSTGHNLLLSWINWQGWLITSAYLLLIALCAWIFYRISRKPALAASPSKPSL